MIRDSNDHTNDSYQGNGVAACLHVRRLASFPGRAAISNFFPGQANFIWELAFLSLWLKSFMTGGFLLNHFRSQPIQGFRGSGVPETFRGTALAVGISPEFIFGVELETRSKIHALGAGVLCCEWAQPLKGVTVCPETCWNAYWSSHWAWECFEGGNAQQMHRLKWIFISNNALRPDLIFSTVIKPW